MLSGKNVTYRCVYRRFVFEIYKNFVQILYKRCRKSKNACNIKHRPHGQARLVNRKVQQWSQATVLPEQASRVYDRRHAYCVLLDNTASVVQS